MELNKLTAAEKFDRREDLVWQISCLSDQAADSQANVLELSCIESDLADASEALKELESSFTPADWLAAGKLQWFGEVAEYASTHDSDLAGKLAVFQGLNPGELLAGRDHASDILTWFHSTNLAERQVKALGDFYQGSWTAEVLGLWVDPQHSVRVDFRERTVTFEYDESRRPDWSYSVTASL